MVKPVLSNVKTVKSQANLYIGNSKDIADVQRGLDSYWSSYVGILTVLLI